MKPETLKARWLKQDEEQIDAALGALLQHPGGRKLLWWMLGIGGVGSQPFAGDPQRTAFNCGQLNVGNQLLERIVRTDPSGYVFMMQEQADERRERDEQLGAAERGPTEPDYFGYPEPGGDA